MIPILSLMPRRLTLALLGTVLALGGVAVATAEDAPLSPELQYSLLVETEASYTHAEEDSSDLVLATFELGLSARLTDYLAVEGTLLYEEDDTEEFTVDTAIVKLGPTDQLPLSLAVGRQYLPFGLFEGNMVSDPLTLELGEIDESAAVLSLEQEYLSLALGAFNGNVGEDEVRNLVGAAALRIPDLLQLGAYGISDIRETDGLQDTANALLEPSVDPVTGEELPGARDDEIPGAGAYAVLTLQPVTLIGEYLTALDEWEISGQKYQPSAYAVELDCALGDKITLAARYQASDEFVVLQDGEISPFPDEVYGGTASCALNDNLSLSLEYQRNSYEDVYHLHDEDVVTLQLALEL